MPQSTQEKKQRFARIFPDRVARLMDQFRLIGNCSAKANYEWNQETVAKVWIHMLRSTRASAKEFGLDVDFKINGKSLDDLEVEGSVKGLFSDQQAPLF